MPDPRIKVSSIRFTDIAPQNLFENSVEIDMSNNMGSLRIITVSSLGVSYCSIIFIRISLSSFNRPDLINRGVISFKLGFR